MTSVTGEAHVGPLSDDGSPREGNFRLTRLEPGRYLLRFSNSPAGELFVERQVDLTLGDVELAPERIGLAEFVRLATDGR